MNREIKFKAKRLDNGEWVCGFFYQENDNTYIIADCQKDSPLNRNIPYKVDPNAVCQFTGMKDANGAELWENDIITAKSILGRELKGKIIYLNACYFLGIMDEQGREKAICELWKLVDICRKDPALDKYDDHE